MGYKTPVHNDQNPGSAKGPKPRLWTIHGDGKHLGPTDVVAPEERLDWNRTIGIGMQHVIAMFGAAPCQCFSPGGNQTVSPARTSRIGPPKVCTRPIPAVICNV